MLGMALDRSQGKSRVEESKSLIALQRPYGSHNVPPVASRFASLGEILCCGRDADFSVREIGVFGKLLNLEIVALQHS